ncbi:Acetyltransferase (GNAT) domain-containing protein [Apibacter mensalis]|uniref:Acetyltransferase (GNAT) domain-containing protein n=1 Tax=Apibacter mensalis TaxID=1586267 RepID=A0A0X3AS93_9FLAO|nr:GNAT family N-acetyltransferase [Apibacter mensalis]CVK16748.1 Acetyltransferase (GNAT) domain-containing protein [Apibacter mensalis]
MKFEKLNLLDLNEVIFIENIYTKSFPVEERRPTDKMFKIYEDYKDKFKILLCIKDNERIGFITYWKLNNFIFIEHFAISSDYRRLGYGSKIMQLFIKKISLPIVLEVEPPSSHWDERRIIFYERLGFKLWNTIEYMQPSYHQDGKSYPMKLMSLREINIDKEYQNVINLIHSEVYHV